MKFHIPGAPTQDQAESIYQAICKFIGAPAIAHPNDRIWGVRWKHEDHIHHAKVDRVLDGFEDGELIVAIVEMPDHYAVCTRSNGVLSGEPLRAPKSDVIQVWKFFPPPE